MDIIQLVVTWLVMAVSFVIVSKIPIGVEIDTFGKALLSAAVFGILNTFLGPIFQALLAPLNLLFSAILIAVIINAIIFGLAAFLVPGFRLRWGIWSALLGAVALAIVREILTYVLGQAL